MSSIFFLLLLPIIVGGLDYGLGRIAPKAGRAEALQRSLLVTLVVLSIGMVWDSRNATIERLDSPALDIVRNQRLRPIALNLLETDKKVGTNNYLNRYFETELSQINNDLTSIGEGRFELKSGDLNQFMIAAFTSAKNSVLATSYVNPGDWWNNAWGKEYQRLNLDAADRGVHITRIFIYSSDSEIHDMCALMNDQQKHGIEIKVVDRSALGNVSPPDVIIIDDSIAGSMSLSDRRTAGGADFYTTDFSINRLKKDFQSVLYAARDFKGCPTR